MYKKLLLLVLILSLSFQLLLAQKQTNIWYFGTNAGLDFTTGVPVPLTNGALSTQEGCSSISDSSGTLQLYSDGTTVWNRNHVPMPNGMGLSGNSSSSQSAMIIPKPQDPSIYYVFTVPGNAAGALEYSEVDMTLNGGLGDVTANKNIALITPVLEKVTAVHHDNGRDVWVITHQSATDGFYAYLVSPTGVNTTPVVSNVGSVAGGGQVWGCIKASPCGNYVAIAHCNLNGELFAFDNATGQLTFMTTLLTSQPSMRAPYGVEFSPSGDRLYMGTWLTTRNMLFQFDLTQPTPADIAASIDTIYDAQNSNTTISTFQLGPDGKIYVAFEFVDSISVINDPEALGTACNFVRNQHDLGGQQCRMGLPPFLQTFFCFDPPRFTEIVPCFGDSAEFRSTSTDADSVLWNFGDPGSGVFNSSTNELQQHMFSAPGNYLITLYKWTNGVPDTAYKTIEVFDVPSIDLGPDLDLCVGETVELNGYSPVVGVTYLWQDSSLNSTFTVTETGTYHVYVDNNGCFDADTINVNVGESVFEGFELKIDEELPLCFGDTILLNGYHPMSLRYSWQDSSITDSIFEVSSPGTYYVELSDSCETVLFPITITYQLCDTPFICNTVELPSAFSPNRDGLNDYFRPRTVCNVTNFEFAVYNRWGQKVHESNDIGDKGWNGRFNEKLSEIGSYIWFVRFTDKDNFTYSERGEVTLIR